jgi:hypothetical protein
MAVHPWQGILNTPILSRIRRNHGLEHATLHILSQRFPRTPMGGHSTAMGFRLLGDLPTQEVEKAVSEALLRLRAGERRLAVHPNCGTNFVTAGILSGLAGALAMLGVGSRPQDKLERLALAAALATLALIVAAPVGLRLQEQITTSGVPGSLAVVSITRSQMGRMTLHTVQTRG